MLRMLRRLFACFVALASTMATVATIAPAGHAATPPSGATATSTGLSAWKSCGKHLQCAVLVGPGRLLAARREAGVDRSRAGAGPRPRRRLGSLVFNFGGPGDAGTTTLPGFATQIPADIRARYDLVSFDPRGTGSSRPVKCVDNATADRLNAVDPTPNSDADLQSFYDGTHEPVDLVARCVARNGTWLAQLGSRNVARDLDRLRGALRDDTLTYLGFSYGTVIGAVYAQMFPDRVGKMVLDSPVDLSATPLEELRGNSDGFEQALDDFLADCAARSSCSFHRKGDPTKALRALAGALRTGSQPADHRAPSPGSRGSGGPASRPSTPR